MLQEASVPVVLDEILIEDKYQFKAFTKICARAAGGFTIKFDFVEVNPEKFKHLISLCHLNKALKFCSTFFTDHDFSINQIIIANFRTDENKNMQWECLLR
ncbi:MAG: hypothetical protein WC716_08625 [Chitinophagaceae bacterium]|jgi:hypothetical protein